MKVALTGGTGFLGSHTAAALQRAGHDVRLLVRSVDKVAQNLPPTGADPDAVEIVSADVTDSTAVAAALDGCDAVIHAASVYSLDPSVADEIAHTNRIGVDNVLGAAIEHDLDPIVHVSSFVALLRQEVVDAVLDEDSPPGNAPAPYAGSKARQEARVRALQDQGHPIVITYPGGVFGPHDPYDGESLQVARKAIKGEFPLLADLGLPIVDVRDVAELHAAIIEPGRGPRRYMVAGNYTPSDQLVRLITDAAGQPRSPKRMPLGLALGIARFSEWLRAKTGIDLGVNYETVWVGSRRARVDNTRIAEEFGIVPRPLEETLTDQVRWMQEAGRI